MVRIKGLVEQTVIGQYLIYCAYKHTHLLFFWKGLFEWLKSAELRSTEEFMVGSDLESVKEQLCDLKVSLYTKVHP